MVLFSVREETGLPLAEGLDTVTDLPYTISSAIMYKKRIESFNELPKEKRPPRYMWDRSHELSEFLEHVWDMKEDKKDSNFYEYDPDNIE